MVWTSRVITSLTFMGFLLLSETPKENECR